MTLLKPRVWALSISCLLVACGSPPPAEMPGGQDDGGQSRTDMVQPEGWKEIYMISGNSARVHGRGEITISTIGHFKITRNDCYREAYGAIELEPWNRLARGMNALLKLPPLAEEQCFARPTRPRDYSLDFQADVITEAGKVTLFDVRGYHENAKICTRVPDEALARQVVAVLDEVLPQAYREDCASE